MCYTSGTTGNPEGRRLQPPRAGAAVLRAVHDRRLRAPRGATRAVGRADVPRQRLGPAVQRHHGGRLAGLPRRAADSARHRAADPGRARHGHRRRPDGAARPAAGARAGVIRPLQPPRGAVRRIGGARSSAGTLRRARHQGHPGLGHDRDVAARDGIGAAQLDGRLERRTPARQCAPSRACRCPASRSAWSTTRASRCRGTARASASSRCAGPWIAASLLRRPALGRRVPRRLVPHRRRRQRSTPTATCRSPTAPRTSSRAAASGSRASSSRT